MPGIPQVWLEEFIANLTTTGSQTDPDIVQLANGNILVAWTSDDDTGVGSQLEPDIIGQIFDPMGNRVGGEILINNGSFFADTENNVDLVALPNGGFVAVYQDVDVATSLRLIQYNSAGAVVSTTFAQQNIVDDLTAAGTSYRNPQIAVSNSTQAIIVYEETSGATTSVQMRTYDPTAQTFGAQQLIMFDTIAPSVATLSSGDIVIVGTRPTSGDNSIAMRILNPDGTNQLPFTAVADTVGDGFNDFDASVAALSGGGYVVVFTDVDGTDTDTSFRIYDNLGTEITLAATNVQAGTNNDNEAVVAGLEDGTFVIVYDDDTDDQVEVAHYNATGGLLGRQTISGPGSQMAVRDLGDGRFAVTFESLVAGGEIRMEILDTRDFVNDQAVYTDPNWQVGTIGNDVIVTDVDSDIVHGHTGNDDITDSTSSGGNQYFGDAGDDILRVGNVIDSDVWNGGGDTDTLDLFTNGQSGLVINLTAGTITAGAASEVAVNFENANGSQQNDTIIGTAGVNVLRGFGGNDVINGGANGDVMQGGADNDTYFVDNAADLVDESVPGSTGTDTVRSSISFSLVIGGDVLGDVENVILLGAGNINALGNGLVNTLTGNTGANVLNGGAGADTMIGGAGNDTYTVDNVGDVANEAAAGSNGVDLVRSIVSFSLADPAHALGAIENVTLLGAGNLNALGNNLNNLMIGNTGANTLNGGLGADIMRGGAGNDTYTVDNAGDLVDESVAGSNGIDLIRSTVTVNLNAPAQVLGAVENVTLLGAANAIVYGNTLANVITGNTGANVLAGGLGNDTLTGGTGNDIFLFNTALGAANIDSVTDMNQAGNDTIRLDDSVFAGLALGALAAGAFHVGATAADASDRVIYNIANGQLIFDTNGNGAGGATVFAVLDAGLAMTAADFFIV